ncbi:hypothetical protein M0R45_006216 [Rubus argutus]|uniref:Uncharacterized protein n=1 Tax=Rubus argutus TaxID=59490 RepID=A0AAW1YQ63_RUBAR
MEVNHKMNMILERYHVMILRMFMLRTISLILCPVMHSIVVAKWEDQVLGQLKTDTKTFGYSPRHQGGRGDRWNGRGHNFLNWATY